MDNTWHSTPFPPERTGRLVAVAREGWTTNGRDWVFDQLRGTGRFVGVVQSMQYEHYCEGDEHFFLDGSRSPAFHGTGSEDYYLTCFWPNLHAQFPFGGHVGDPGAQAEKTGVEPYHLPSSYFRWHLDAPLPFYSEADLRIQHGGLSDVHSWYRSLSFCYVHPQVRLQLTDVLNVGLSGSENMHEYQCDAGLLVRIKSMYEADDSGKTERRIGRVHGVGSIRFNLAIDPANAGVRIVRQLDQAAGVQRALITINGEPAGTWHFADENPFKRFADDAFEIPLRLTQGRESLEVVIDPIADRGESHWTDFRYEAMCYLPWQSMSADTGPGYPYRIKVSDFMDVFDV